MNIDGAILAFQLKVTFQSKLESFHILETVKTSQLHRDYYSHSYIYHKVVTRRRKRLLEYQMVQFCLFPGFIKIL